MKEEERLCFGRNQIKSRSLPGCPALGGILSAVAKGGSAAQISFSLRVELDVALTFAELGVKSILSYSHLISPFDCLLLSLCCVGC